MLEIIVDLKTLRDENPDITVGEIIENHIVPKLPNARYFSVNNYPYIVLPWIDGTYSDDWNPVIEFNTIATTKATSATKIRIAVGVIKMSGNTCMTMNVPYKVVSANGSGTANSSSNISFATNLFVWREYTHGDMRCIGVQSWSGSTADIYLISMDFVITKCKTVKTNEDINVAMIAGGYNTGITMWYAYDGQLNDRVSINSFNLPVRDNVINVYQFNDGLIYRNDLYMCFPQRHTILRPMCKFDKSNEVIVNADSWYLNAFTVNGKSFDLKLTSGSTDTYIALAKLRQ